MASSIVCQDCGRPMDLVANGQRVGNDIRDGGKAKEVYAVYECDFCDTRYLWNKGKGIVRRDRQSAGGTYEAAR